ncbi:hypothetical protein [Caulobacter sp. NIBR1757]|uniref:hypothetical protein n=1 Tax=Caulobacter sp. NIBR1757 TaxID=3016000 RepID=UPI0022F00F0F|nr:hypothetical protein [Caulobacter sp. NIBR1757]WGM38860.1 hypothetical protein AMEJIAPC_01767 [Caulobacter sp. NIBR1757]
MRRFITTTVAVLAASCSPAPAEKVQKPAAATSKPTTYLASIVIPLGPGERVSAFNFDTWGVDVVAVCRIPPGWWIKGGRSATAQGVIAGEGSHGVTWIGDMTSLENLMLVSLYGPVRETERKNGPTTWPATFKGLAALETPDTQREVALGHANVRLVPADACP